MIDQTEDDASVLGVDLQVDQEPEHFEVEPDAWPAVQMFLRVQTQWRTGGNGPIGLDYSALAWVFTLWDVKDQVAMLADIQTIEAEILAVISEKES